MREELNLSCAAAMPTKPNHVKPELVPLQASCCLLQFAVVADAAAACICSASGLAPLRIFRLLLRSMTM
jgi:hypothetical protein